MRLIEQDWAALLALMPRWAALPPAARRVLLTVDPARGSLEVGGGTADALVRAGLMEAPGPDGFMHRVPEEVKPLLHALRAMGRARVLDAGGEIPAAYLQAHFTSEQCSRLMNQPAASWNGPGLAARMASSVDWARQVLEFRDAGAARKWEQPRRMPAELATLAVPRALHTLQRLIPALAQHPQGVPLARVGELVPEATRQELGAALQAGVRYLFLFPTLRGLDPEAYVGLLPAVARRLGPPPPPPGPVPVGEQFEAPFRLGDMTAVLVEAASTAIPVRGNDGRLYARAQKAVAGRLAGLPEWLEAQVLLGDAEEDEAGPAGPSPAEAERIAFAVDALMSRKLAQIRKAGDRWQLSATKSGQQWLALPEADRLRAVLNGFRDAPERLPGSWYVEPGKVDFFGARLGFDLRGVKVDLREALGAAFLSADPEGLTPAREFVLYHAEVRNPFLAEGVPKVKGGGGWGGAPGTREGWESAWAQLLMGFLILRLVPYGGVRLGLVGEEDFAFRLTDVGRYLLGAADGFDYAAAPEGEVVVQPDFEIVFLAPAPRVEAELARFAERTGSGVGALFRITRAAVLRAAEQGLTAEVLLDTLGRVSRTPVPENVARQVRDWIGGTRRVTIRTAVLVECPDAETAAKVRAAAGAQAVEISPTVLRLDAGKGGRPALVKKLRERGIFVEG